MARKAPAQAGFYLREWRKLRKVTLEKLAAMMGDDAGNLSKVERGLIQYTGRHVEGAAAALRIEPAELFRPPSAEIDRIQAILRNMSPESRRRAELMIEALASADTTHHEAAE